MPRWINRAAIVIRPARPYIEWASRVDDDAPEQAKELDKRVSIYLVAEDPNEKGETAPHEAHQTL